MTTASSRVLRNIPLPEPYLAGMAVGYVLHRRWPMPLPGAHSLRPTVGLSLLASGSAIIASSLVAVGRVDLQHPERLVTWGPYAMSRNPMYVGWGLLHLGAALIIGSAGWLPLFRWPPRGYTARSSRRSANSAVRSARSSPAEQLCRVTCRTHTWPADVDGNGGRGRPVVITMSR